MGKMDMKNALQVILLLAFILCIMEGNRKIMYQPASDGGDAA